MNRWEYALLCLILPILWGLLVVWVAGLLERRRKATRPEYEDESSIHPDYYI